MLIYILFCHWLNDFVGQSFLFPSLEIGKNKSKSVWILWLHIFLYSLGMWLMIHPFMGGWHAFWFMMINGGSHLVIDSITSRLSSDAYEHNSMGLFWSIIGFDQFLHVAILCATL